MDECMAVTGVKNLRSFSVGAQMSSSLAAMPDCCQPTVLAAVDLTSLPSFNQHP